MTGTLEDTIEMLEIVKAGKINPFRSKRAHVEASRTLDDLREGNISTRRLQLEYALKRLAQGFNKIGQAGLATALQPSDVKMACTCARLAAAFSLTII